MQYQRQLLFAIAICLVCNGCSPRLIKYNRYVNRVAVGEMKQDEFDREFYSLCPPPYQEKDYTHWLEYDGCYVYHHSDGSYQAYSFNPRGRALRTIRLEKYPDNLSLLTVQKERLYFDTEGYDIRIEYLQSRDWKLHNIIMTGQVAKDTITIKSVQHQRAPYNKSEVDITLIYDPNLEPLQ